MIHHPDLPNAPMTRWILYLQLFDFYLQHVPCERHKVPDGLSRRKQSPLDSDDSDAEEYLNAFLDKIEFIEQSKAGRTGRKWSDNGESFVFNPSMFPYLQDIMRFQSNPSHISTLSCSPNNPSCSGLHMQCYQHRVKELDTEVHQSIPYSLLEDSLLTVQKNQFYTGYKFFYRKIATKMVLECSLGEEIFETKLTIYKHAYISEQINNEEASTEDQSQYPQLDPRQYQREFVACIGHKFGMKDEESDELWEEIIWYLKDGTLPGRCSSPRETKKFVRRAKQFIFHDD